ncbi:MAG: diguanylate cyclase, partial [Anaerolineales bacterium]|nr:diguanylate cyclase [Anaerolineales bacterium]
LAIAFFIGFVWAYAYSMELASHDMRVKITWVLIRLSFLRFIGLTVLWMIYEYLGLFYQRLQKYVPALLIIPALGLSLIWTGEYHHLFRYDYAIQQAGELNILTWKTGPAYWLIYFSDVVIYSAALLQLFLSLSDSMSETRQQTTLIAVGTLAPITSDVLFTFGVTPISGFNITPYIMLFSGGALLFVVFRYGWLNIVPVACNTLVDIIPSGVIITDAKKNIVSINPYAQKILEISAAAIIGQDIQKAFSSLDTGTFPKLSMESGRKELQYKNAKGNTEYLGFEVVALKDQFGSLSGHLVYFNNITKRMERELRLQQLTQAVDQSPASVVITDADGAITYVNPYFSVLSGYTQEEAIGQTPRIIQSGVTSESVYQDMWQTIKAGRIWRGEFLNKKKNGELYWEMEVIAPVFGDKGDIVNFIAVKEDITTRKQVEEQLRRANRQMENSLRKIEGLQASLREQAIRDPLTQLYNRRFMDESIEREFHYAERQLQPLSIVLLDIDHFKKINDTHGHRAGDEYLIMLAKLLQNYVRKSDIVCRYGGEEFLLVLPNSNFNSAAQHAEELRRLIEDTAIVFEGKEIKATISLGVATYPTHSASYSEIINKADLALYASKRAGRNRVTVWTET